MSDPKQRKTSSSSSESNENEPSRETNESAEKSNLKNEPSASRKTIECVEKSNLKTKCISGENKVALLRKMFESVRPANVNVSRYSLPLMKKSSPNVSRSQVQDKIQWFQHLSQPAQSDLSSRRSVGIPQSLQRHSTLPKFKLTLTDCLEPQSVGSDYASSGYGSIGSDERAVLQTGNISRISKARADFKSSKLQEKSGQSGPFETPTRQAMERHGSHESNKTASSIKHPSESSEPLETKAIISISSESGLRLMQTESNLEDIIADDNPASMGENTCDLDKSSTGGNGECFDRALNIPDIFKPEYESKPSSHESRPGSYESRPGSYESRTLSRESNRIISPIEHHSLSSGESGNTISNESQSENIAIMSGSGSSESRLRTGSNLEDFVTDDSSLSVEHSAHDFDKSSPNIRQRQVIDRPTSGQSEESPIEYSNESQSESNATICKSESNVEGFITDNSSVDNSSVRVQERRIMDKLSPRQSDEIVSPIEHPSQSSSSSSDTRSGELQNLGIISVGSSSDSQWALSGSLEGFLSDDTSSPIEECIVDFDKPSTSGYVAPSCQSDTEDLPGSSVKVCSVRRRSQGKDLSPIKEDCGVSGDNEQRTYDFDKPSTSGYVPPSRRKNDKVWYGVTIGPEDYIASETWRKTAHLGLDLPSSGECGEAVDLDSPSTIQYISSYFESDDVNMNEPSTSGYSKSTCEESRTDPNEPTGSGYDSPHHQDSKPIIQESIIDPEEPTSSGYDLSHRRDSKSAYQESKTEPSELTSSGYESPHCRDGEQTCQESKTNPSEPTGITCQELSTDSSEPTCGGYDSSRHQVSEATGQESKTDPDEPTARIWDSYSRRDSEPIFQRSRVLDESIGGVYSSSRRRFSEPIRRKPGTDSSGSASGEGSNRSLENPGQRTLSISSIGATIDSASVSIHIESLEEDLNPLSNGGRSDSVSEEARVSEHSDGGGPERPANSPEPNGSAGSSEEHLKPRRGSKEVVQNQPPNRSPLGRKESSTESAISDLSTDISPSPSPSPHSDILKTSSKQFEKGSDLRSQIMQQKLTDKLQKSKSFDSDPPETKPEAGLAESSAYSPRSMDNLRNIGSDNDKSKEKEEIQSKMESEDSESSNHPQLTRYQSSTDSRGSESAPEISISLSLDLHSDNSKTSSKKREKSSNLRSEVLRRKLTHKLQKSMSAESERSEINRETDLAGSSVFTSRSMDNLRLSDSDDEDKEKDETQSKMKEFKDFGGKEDC